MISVNDVFNFFFHGWESGFFVKNDEDKTSFIYFFSKKFK